MYAKVRQCVISDIFYGKSTYAALFVELNIVAKNHAKVFKTK